ncbi:hypothetical protein TNCV_2277301 [Trichonephila clavipes]|nr:hypothetical protein TNCV_2277301 [Trichonephila clavipes]
MKLTSQIALPTIGVGEHGGGRPHGQIANSRKGNASYIKPRHEWGESVTRLTHHRSRQASPSFDPGQRGGLHEHTNGTRIKKRGGHM